MAGVGSFQITMLRSSATRETLADRGAYRSLRATAIDEMSAGLRDIASHFEEHTSPGVDLAILVQPVIEPLGWHGHISNERRVSPTVNQWLANSEGAFAVERGFNSWRSALPAEGSALSARDLDSMWETWKAVARWVVELNRGPAHLEAAWDGERAWILQIDFEDEAPDAGVDPSSYFNGGDLRPCGGLPKGSPFSLGVPGTAATDWKKIEAARLLSSIHLGRFPSLFVATAADIRAALDSGRNIEDDIKAITHGGAVCRTDRKGKFHLNLPRTDTETPAGVMQHIEIVSKQLQEQGVAADQVAFILHKFLPARSCAWAVAEPGSRHVKIDALWGVPDGLQYLPHDSFEFDAAVDRVVAMRIRFKPAFIQETDDGSWMEVPVRRTSARSRSLGIHDVSEVARATLRLAKIKGEKIQVMWFCDLPVELGIGRNLPWIYLHPEEAIFTDIARAGPQARRRRIRSLQDLVDAEKESTSSEVLSLQPSIALVRDKEFLSRVITLAKSRAMRVEISGSVLAHAYYEMVREGITVSTGNDSRRMRSRVRNKQVFGKLVRDKIPDRIAAAGEVAEVAHLSRGDMRAGLVGKLMEEALELLASDDADHIVEELADVLEVLRALGTDASVDWNRIESAAEQKRLVRGGFDEGWVLEGTHLPTAIKFMQQSDREVSLDDLTSTLDESGSVIFNFAALLSASSPIHRLADDLEITARLVRGGVKVSVTPRRHSASSEQLSFDF
jgi:predicted house-cleaning noncanonical NTP pyrophosphatase (MazG superfamily)